MRTQPGFDPFQNGWEAFEEGGLDAVENTEAPLMLYVAEPDLAQELAGRYAAHGLDARDLRFGVWPDASPVQVREPDEPVGVHLNVFGSTQVRYGLATPVEKAALTSLTDDMEEHVRDAIDPEHGVGVMRFGKIPTMHHHVIARERRDDGTYNWLDRPLVDLEVRREMRSRVALDQVPGRREQIADRLTAVLRGFAR